MRYKMKKNYFLFIVSALFILLQGCGNIPGSSNPMNGVSFDMLFKDDNNIKYFMADEIEAFKVENNKVKKIDIAKYKSKEKEFRNYYNRPYYFAEHGQKMSFEKDIFDKIEQEVNQKYHLKGCRPFRLMDENLSFTEHFLVQSKRVNDRDVSKLFHVAKNGAKYNVDEINLPDGVDITEGFDCYINGNKYNIYLKYDNRISARDYRDKNFQVIPIYSDGKIIFYKSNQFVKKFYDSDFDLFSFIKKQWLDHEEFSIYSDGIYKVYNKERDVYKKAKPVYRYIPFDRDKSVVEIAIPYSK